MKLPAVFLTIFALFIAIAGRGAEVIPKRADFGQYQAMLEHSPFAVATAAALPAATPNFAKDLYIANAARSSEGDLLTLGNLADRNFKEYLTTKGPNEHGYAIASIDWSDRIGGTKATISKDGQFATIGFNQALVSSPIPAAATQPPSAFRPPTTYRPQGNAPATTYRPPRNVPAATPITRPVIPSLPTPRPHIRGIIPRNPNMSAAATPMIVPKPPEPADEEDE